MMGNDNKLSYKDENDPEDFLDNTQEKQKELEQKCEEYLLGWKRALADYDNLKKEIVREKKSLQEFILIDYLERLFPIVDHFAKAIQYKPNDVSKEIEYWFQGILCVESQLRELLKELGVKSFGQEGDLFDAHQHEAIASRSDPLKEEGVILEVQQVGWKREEKVLRPAKVIINKISDSDS